MRKQGAKVVSLQWLLDCKKFHKRLSVKTYVIPRAEGRQVDKCQQQKEKNEDAAVIDLDEFGTSTKQFDKLEEETAASAAVPPNVTLPDAAVPSNGVGMLKEVGNEVPSTLHEYASQRLSKWTARFMHKRPKLELPPPDIIPLNDEYLAKFGEKFKKVAGPSLLPIQPPDDDVESDDDSNGAAKRRRLTDAKQEHGSKITVSNLPYNICSVDKMHAVYTNAGTLLNVDVLMHDPDKSENGRRSGLTGKCILTFKTEEEALVAIKCTDMYEVGGRRLSVYRVDANGKPIGDASRRAPKPDRYYVDPDSVKKTGPVCLNCRQPGHFIANCPLEKRCSICARPSHSDRECPNTLTCFRCLQPGHMARNCSYQEPVVNPNAKQLCTVCGGRDHEKWQCTRMNLMVEAYARCMACGVEGHLCCMAYCGNTKTEVWCCNCGIKGHDYLMCPELRQS